LRHKGAKEGAPYPGTQLAGMRGGENVNGDIQRQVQDEVPRQQNETIILQIKIMFQNINGLPAEVNNPKNDSLKETMINHQIDIMGLSKINIAWHKAPGHTRMGERTAEWFEARQVSVAWNQTDQQTSVNQFGGVALISTNKLVYHIESSGADPWGLGRWAWTRFRGKQGHHTRVAICYRPVYNDKGPLLVYNQQWRFFLSQNQDGCLRQLYMQQLRQSIQEWKEMGDTLIIGSNWNNDTAAAQWKGFGMT